jgi:hypothetical protein
MRSAIPMSLLLAATPLTAQIGAPPIPPAGIPTRDSLRGVLEPPRESACATWHDLFSAPPKALTEQDNASRTVVVYGATLRERGELESARFVEDPEAADRVCGITVRSYALPPDLAARDAAALLARIAPDLRWRFVRD